MDEFRIHLRALPRRFPSVFPVATLGWKPSKRERVRHRFDAAVVSVITKGAGDLRIGANRALPVVAPCSLVQWPGPVLDYGPAIRWDELYLEYDPHHLDGLQRCGAIDPQHPVRPVVDAPAVRRLVDELLRLAALGQMEQQIDAIDRISDRLLVEVAAPCPSHGAHRRSGSGAQLIEAIRGEIDADPLARDPFLVARRHGLGPSALRRAWARQLRVPPLRYRQEALLRLACRALVDSDRRIGDIASSLGFTDPLYFARRFRAFTGSTASAYRQRWRRDVASGQVDGSVEVSRSAPAVGRR